MKKIWKVLGVAALAVGLTPYQVEKDEETGEKKYQALLWKATRTHRDEEKDELSIHISFNPPQRKKEEEIHLYSEDLNVKYGGEEKSEEESEEVVEKPAEDAEEPAEPAPEEAESAQESGEAEEAQTE